MNKLYNRIFIYYLAILCFGCGKERYREIPWSTLEQARSFKATIKRIEITEYGKLRQGSFVFIGMRTGEGRKVCLTVQEAGPEIEGFARSLKEGREYEFPTVWVDYKAGRQSTPAQ